LWSRIAALVRVLKPNDDGSIATDARPARKASHQVETEVENVKFKLDAEARALGLVDVEISLKSATIGDISLSVVYNVEIGGKEKRCVLTIYGISKTALKDRLKRGRLGILTSEQRAWIGSQLVPETEAS
jgi:hypothetical protein